jgi:hypothetical protein
MGKSGPSRGFEYNAASGEAIFSTQPLMSLSSGAGEECVIARTLKSVMAFRWMSQTVKLLMAASMLGLSSATCLP